MNTLNISQRTAARFRKNYHQSEPDKCWVWTGATNGKYGWFWFDGRPMMAHRFAWLLAIGGVEDGLLVCHRCDNPPCVNPAHLFLGTTQDNTADRHTKGRSHGPQGANHAMAMLREADIPAIRQDARPSRLLGRIYGVSKTQILRIKNRKSWNHL